MKTTLHTIKAIAAASIILTNSFASIACEDQAASTRDESQQVCQLFCTGDCSSAWTTSTTLWCKTSPGSNCGTQSLNPPINITIHYASGSCGYVNDECVCVVDLTWDDVQFTDTTRTTEQCEPQ